MFQAWLIVYPTVAETVMGKPLSKASDGGRSEILGVTEHITQSELQHGSGTGVPIQLEVRPEAFPTGLPMPVRTDSYAISGYR
jgi:hypothetical protein